MQKKRIEKILRKGRNIRKHIDSNIPPPNSPVTVNGGWIYNRAAHKSVYVPGKGFNKPLFDTGALYDAFDYEIPYNATNSADLMAANF